MEKENLFRSILVSTDSSEGAIIAEQFAAPLAKKLDSKVTVFYVVTHELMRPGMQKFLIEKHQHFPAGTGIQDQEAGVYIHTEPKPESLPNKVVNEITESYREKAEEVVREAATAFEEAGVKVDTKIVHKQDAAEAIVEEGKAGKHDLIIVGHGGGKKEPFLGGIPEKVSRHAENPVIVAKTTGPISKVLVAVDGSENAIRALIHASSIAEKLGASITILHVQEEGLFRGKSKIAEQVGRRILDDAASATKLRNPDQKLSVGRPAETIVRSAEEGKYDLIVLGKKGHGGLSRFLIGSVTEHVLHHTTRSVMLVR